ncbi:hypothetical protein [Mobilicoccus pelagius]|uniref:Fibronectin type-III domain-containing protein n=1 Tax=Mobilicoccus pelagius NBRC 104925 TaxID=1089455 RepID=H5UQU4_9MICO|nr:hypothetical protein [Mobilicoccus pelagius]GAB48102.1 hypothetical protein MOPEL_060_00180 [Mobilicoccus pelagius NBRC 104925]
MPHGSGTTLSALTAVALAATGLTAVAPATRAAADTHDAVVSVTDGCGRVDFLEVDTKGDYWVEVWPDGKAPKPEGSDPWLTGQPEIVWKRSLKPLNGTDWSRPADTTKSFTLVRVLEWDDDREDFVYLPLAWSHAPDGTRGTEMLRLTNEDCVQPEEPTFTDEVGSDRDTVTIPSVTGVKYSGKPGVPPGKGTMTVTATADKGYRLATSDGAPLPADQTRWSYTFDGASPVDVPAGKVPTFRYGDVAPATKTKPAVRGPNLVVVRNVPGVTWMVDGKAVKTSDKASVVEVPVGTKTSVEVEAVSASPKDVALVGTTRWTVGPSGASRPVPKVVVPTSAVARGASTVTWAPPSDFPANSRYDVRYRVVTLTPNQVRARATWRPWLLESSARKGTLKARPGTIAEVQVRAVAGRRVSPWSAPTTVWFPLDIAAAQGRTWKVAKEPAAFGGTMLTTPQRTSAWTARTSTTNRIMLWFGTSPKGAPAAIYVDGKRVATVNTKSRSTTVRQVLKPIPVLWGRHVVTVVHAGKNGQTLRLDAASYGR